MNLTAWLAINSADDLINPAESHMFNREIKRLPQGRAVLIPFYHFYYAGMGI